MSLITLPASIKESAARVHFSMLRQQSVIQTLAGVSQVTSFPDRRWQAQVQIVPQYRDDLRLWSLAITQLSDLANVFALGPPHYNGPSSGYAGAEPVVKDQDQLGTSLVVDGVTGGATILLPGDFISFDVTSLKGNTNRQLIQVTNTVTADGSGNATIQLATPIRQSPAENEPVSIKTPTAFFSLVRAEGGVEIVPGMWSPFVLDAIERVFP